MTPHCSSLWHHTRPWSRSSPRSDSAHSPSKAPQIRRYPASLTGARTRDPKLRYGDAYLRLGDALMALGRHEEAERAYDALIGINSSTVEGYVKLARARKARGDEPGAQRAYDEARATYRQLPGFLRRRDWSWAVRAFLGW